jgi:hypothetical protein
MYQYTPWYTILFFYLFSHILWTADGPTFIGMRATMLARLPFNIVPSGVMDTIDYVQPS